jgi:hypothetical protein
VAGKQFQFLEHRQYRQRVLRAQIKLIEVLRPNRDRIVADRLFADVAAAIESHARIVRVTRHADFRVGCGL